MERDIKDQRHYEPQSLAEIQREFPIWHMWMGTNRLYYARPKGCAPGLGWDVERAEDLMDLRDQIIVCLRRHET